MQADLIGRVSNFTLRTNSPLIPLFEAIVNSIHSTAEMTESGMVSEYKPQVKVTVIRYCQKTIESIPNDVSLLPVEDFVIEDNGMGFTSRNFEAFKTLDTTNKISVGGKGVGRLTWLKAFSSIRAESIFTENDLCYKRSFIFDIKNGVNSETNIILSQKEANRTTVSLEGYKSEYSDQCPKKIKSIASKVMEHCLSFFVLGKCPILTLLDEQDSINLNELFEEEIEKQINISTFNISDYKFCVRHIKIYHPEALGHKIHYCAHNREVFSNIIGIPDLCGALLDENKKSFYYSAYVSSSFLDSKVNEGRTGFIGYQGTENDELEFLCPGELSWKEIKKELYVEIEKYLISYLEPLRIQKFNRIERHIKNEAPQFLPIFRRKPEEIASISPNELEPKKLNLALYKIKQKEDLKTKQKIEEILHEDVSTIAYTDACEEKIRKIIPTVTEDGKATLAEYIIQRKVILKLLERRMGLQQTGQYSKEDRIHELIIPMNVTSEDNDFGTHNLWLIDERLAYHHFLASDKQLIANKPIQSNSTDRPDVITYNNIYDIPLAYAGDKPPFQSITILEFKRPVRNDYNKENPIDQVIRYVRKIEQSTCLTKEGRQIEIRKGTPFYCYILCDLTPKLREIIEERNFKPTPDAWGYYFYHDTLNAYIEVISFDKLLKDATQRNQVLFDKLNI